MDRRGRPSTGSGQALPHILVHRSAAARDRGLVPRSLGEGGFTLVEVLVALILLLIGAYATLRLFPAGFAAIERSRYESIAARLADQEIQRWRLSVGSLPEAIVWGDSSTGSLIYRTDYDPNSLVPNPARPNWQADSAYLPRTIIGEMMPVGDIEVGGAVTVPLCRLRYGPLDHLYDNPADGPPLLIYTTEYERVDDVGFLLDSAAPAPKDWGRYYINYDQGTISFDYVPGSGYDRQFRVEFTYLLPNPDPNAPPERKYDTWVTAQIVSVPAGYDSTPTGPLGQGPIPLWGGAGSPGGFQGVVPLSERVNQAFIFDSGGSPAGPGHFALDGGIADPAAHVLFYPTDAGRTVNVDYRVRDWQILLEERVPDAGMQIKLSISPVKSPTYTNPPRQPVAPNRLVPVSVPGNNAMVIIIDTETGSRLPAANVAVDYNGGIVTLSGPAQAGHTYRVYYRGEMDWTVQPIKAASHYAVMTGGTPGYRSAVWSEGTNEVDFGRSELAKNVVASYYMYADAPADTNPVPVVGELHQIAPVDGGALVKLDHQPAWGDIRIQGASMRARVLWAGRGTTTAVNGELSPERWQHVAVDSFLRRP